MIWIGEEFLIPKFSEPDYRSRNRESLEFYDDGAKKSIYLESFQRITTPIGRIQAEFITFYPSGEIHRVFPVFGKISGYWSEAEEGELLPVTTVNIGGNRITAKIGVFCFYPTGALKSITLWPGEDADVVTKSGTFKARYGISFYSNEMVASLEPEKGCVVSHPTGVYIPYNSEANGISGDKNSLEFYEDGRIKALTSTITKLQITDEEGKQKTVGAEFRRSLMDIEQLVLVPVRYEFQEEGILYQDSDGKKQFFSYQKYTITSIQSKENAASCTADCSHCSGCSQKEVS